MNQYISITSLMLSQADGAAPPSAQGGGETVGTPDGSPAPSGGGMFAQGGFSGIFMIVLMFIVFYLLLIRPQQKKAKEHQKMIDSVSTGAEIVTNGGLIGRVSQVKGNVLTLDLGEKIRVRVLRSQVAGLFEAFNQTESGSGTKSEKK